MKVFIAFLGILLIGVSSVSYQGELNRFVHMQSVLKEACEECAAGAALFLDEEEYADGRVVFRQADSKNYAEEYLEYFLAHHTSDGILSASCSLSFKDDRVNDFSVYDAEYACDTAVIRATIRLETRDLFSNSVIDVEEVERTACYELKEL